MTHNMFTIPAQERRIRAVKDGMAVIEHKAHEMKFVTVMDEETDSYIGASPADSLSSSITIELVRKHWNAKKEGKEYRDFLRFLRNYENTSIPEVKEEMKNKILKRFGTLVPEVLATRLGIETQTDPRLSVKTRRGVVKTTVEMQRQYSTSRSAMSFESFKT